MIQNSIYRLLKKLRPVSKDVPEEYKAYYKSRDIFGQKYLCHAPFNNMYFNSQGEVANCWLTFDAPEHYDGTKSIKDIWFGEKFSRLRKAVSEFDLSYKCKTCKQHLLAGNYLNVLSRTYDNEFPLTNYPSMMEFELSNTCNLECTMCNGLLSSVIRKNRENLPALQSPYGDRFIDELREFIPHLKEVRFNGGEPFLIHIYYKIWDLIFELNPELKIVVATNGTILTPRVKQYLERGNFHINLSIDSLNPDTYTEIRVNGNLNEVLRNFEYFKNYCADRKRKLCIMVNPMRQNWIGMSDFVDFCNKNKVHLWFNSVIRPYNQAIWNLPAEKLKNIYETLSAVSFKEFDTPRNLLSYNNSVYTNLVEEQIKTWYKEARVREMLKNKTADIGKSPFEIFEKNLEDFLKQQFKDEPFEADTAGKLIREKIKMINTHLDGRLDQNIYYNAMNELNPSYTFIFLLEHDDEKIKKDLDHFILQYQTNHSVPVKTE